MSLVDKQEGDRMKSRLVRLFLMEALMIQKPMGLRVRELVTATGVDRRTIYRDIAFLQEIGTPVWGEGGRFGIDARYKVPDYRPELLERLAEGLKILTSAP